ncbi:MAG TPA: DoxX family protein [Verrucomicrobiae bacterium]|jgi:putative oxidoreductase|nr:DoxX family protein [Verrucomicrobiae bacterium]
MQAGNSLFARCYGGLVRAANLLQSPVLLALRLYWGWQFFVTGRAHLENLDKTTAFFRSLHIPLPHLNACIAGGTECVGGLLLLVGVGSRLICLPLIFTMIIAYVTAESDSLKQIFSDPDKFVSASPFLFMLTCIIVLAFGPGVFSIDWLIQRCVKPRGKT